MDFTYNIKLRVNILRATKAESVFTKIESIFPGYKNRVDFYKVQKSSRFLQGTKIESIFYKVQKSSRFLASKLQKPSRFLGENRPIKRHNFETNGTP